MNFFVTGTDTEVGKTYFSALLIRALREAGVDAVGFKPVACGGWEDVDALVAASGDTEPRSSICPYQFEMPAAPLAAAWAAEEIIEPPRILAAYEELRSRHEVVIVEGVGGWRVPITVGWDVSDFAKELGLPVILVVRNRLGAINHTRLTLESIERYDLVCAGLVLNHRDSPDDPIGPSNRAVFQMLPGTRVICELVAGQNSLHLPSLALPGLHP